VEAGDFSIRSSSVALDPVPATVARIGLNYDYKRSAILSYIAYAFRNKRASFAYSNTCTRKAKLETGADSTTHEFSIEPDGKDNTTPIPRVGTVL